MTTGCWRSCTGHSIHISAKGFVQYVVNQCVSIEFATNPENDKNPDRPCFLRCVSQEQWDIFSLLGQYRMVTFNTYIHLNTRAFKQHQHPRITLPPFCLSSHWPTFSSWRSRRKWSGSHPHKNTNENQFWTLIGCLKLIWSLAASVLFHFYRGLFPVVDLSHCRGVLRQSVSSFLNQKWSLKRFCKATRKPQQQAKRVLSKPVQMTCLGSLPPPSLAGQSWISTWSNCMDPIKDHQEFWSVFRMKQSFQSKNRQKRN